MTNKELTGLAIKVFAIYVFVQAIILIAQIGVLSPNYNFIESTWIFLVPVFSVIGLIIIFIILWKLSNNIIGFLAKPCEQSDNLKIDQIFVLHLIGIYIFMMGLLGLANGGISLYFLYIYQAHEYGSIYQPEESIQSIFFIFTNLIKLILGLTLLIRPHVWVKVLNRIREFGMSNKT